MSFITNIMKSMRLNQDDAYDLDDDYDFEEEEYNPPRASSGKGRLSQSFDEEEDTEESPARSIVPFGKRKAAPASAPRRGMEVTMIKPTAMEDSKDICNFLLEGKAVVLNMEGLHMEIAQRIIDFTSGAVYSMNGNIQKIANFIFIATPDNVELSGDFQNILAGSAGAQVSGLNFRL